MFVALIAAVTLLAQGPLTTATNLRVRTDANSYLITTTAPDGPLTSFGNIKVRTDSNGYLLTTSSPSGTGNTVYAGDGLVGTPSITFASDPDTGLWHSATNSLAVSAGGALAATFGTSFTLATGVPFVQTAVAFASLGTPADGTMRFCNDCTETTPATCPVTQASCICAGSGTGAFARRVNSTWYCTF